MNLLNAIDMLNQKAEDIIKEYEIESKKLKEFYQTKLDDIYTAIRVNSELNTACVKCRGTGKLDLINEDGMACTADCDECGGSGIIDKN